MPEIENACASDSIGRRETPPGVEVLEIVDRNEWLAWRRKSIGASEAACLLADDLHPFISSYSLWALKSGKVEEAALDTPALKRGRDLEPIVIQRVRELHPEWQVVPGATFYRDPAAKISATPDAFADDPVRGFGTIQCKTASEFAFRKSWRDADREVEPPLWVLVQASIEAFLTGASWACIAVLNMGEWSTHLIEVPLKPALMDRVRELAADFWRRVETGEAYPPNWAHDAKVVGRLFAEAEDREIDLRADNRVLELVAEREAHKAAEALGAEAAKARKAIDAEILLKIGTADRARLADGRIIVAPTVRRKAYEVKATSYRAISVKAAAP